MLQRPQLGLRARYIPQTRVCRIALDRGHALTYLRDAHCYTITQPLPRISETGGRSRQPKKAFLVRTRAGTLKQVEIDISLLQKHNFSDTTFVHFFIIIVLVDLVTEKVKFPRASEALPEGINNKKSRTKSFVKFKKETNSQGF